MSHKLSSLTRQVVQADALLRHPNPNRLFIDVRLGDPQEEFKRYREGHIHGAVHAQIREVFAAPATAQSGNLPLPDVAVLRTALEAWGVDNETELVLYGLSLALAARAWWVLRWAGLDKVQVLDGGLKAWTDHGGAVAQGEGLSPLASRARPLTLRPGGMPAITVSEVEALPRDTVLIDARDEASYLAGHIPHARHLAASQLWTPAAALRTTDELRRLLAGVGATQGVETVAYCGGGVLSALAVLVMTAFGLTPKLYVGSWSEWSKSPQRMAASVSGERAA